MAAVFAAGVLAVVLGFAVLRPRRLPEAVVAVPAAVAIVALGIVPRGQAGEELRALGPTVGFLAAILVLAHLVDADGVFRYLGGVAARASRGSPQRLLVVVFTMAALVTATLSLDATVVLLTPVVLATAARMGARPRPHVYACAHLANSASLLLPVSNLTNLLAFSASGLPFLRFAGLMALPWIGVVGVEYAVFRRFFAADLHTSRQPGTTVDAPPPWFPLAVLALTLIGFPVAEPFGIHPGWVAATGALVLAVPRVVRRPATAVTLVRAADPSFCAFVFAIGVIVLGVRLHGLDTAVVRIVPQHADLAGLLLVAGIAAVLANLVNNIPATLVLVPAVSHSPGLILAVLLGVNVGPNLTYVGSLATLLWRQVLLGNDARPALGDFLRLGAITVPASLTVGVGALWLSLRVLGGT